MITEIGELKLFILLLAVALAVLLLSIWLKTPEYSLERPGRIILLFGLFILPVLNVATGYQVTMARSAETDFCLSCHEMTPYGKSLLIDGEEAVPAMHFQYNYVPQRKACYTCHTNYALFGSLRTKPDALRHLWAHYTGQIPEKMKLFRPYENANCLHCHGSARSFRGEEEHDTPDAPMQEILSGGMSCVDSECHAMTHDIETLDSHVFWHAPFITDVAARMPASITLPTRRGEP